MTENFLLRTLELAQQRKGFCSPNPAVGSIVVHQGRIAGEGTHWAAGHAHAEVEALKEVPDSVARESTVYVSLEPCCHQGKTPPCTDLLIQKRVAKVVFSFEDPNPRVAGKGRAKLEASGIEVEHRPVVAIDAFYKSYRHWVEHRTPLVTVKLAMSLDAKVAGPGGKPVQITSPEMGRFSHLQRRNHDALLTSANTVLADNPRLNVRLEETLSKPVVVLDRLGRTPADAQIFTTAQSVTLLMGMDAPRERRERLAATGAQIHILETPQGCLSLPGVLAQLGGMGFHEVWVETGPALFAAFLKQRLAHKAYLYIAPILIGEGFPAFGEGLSELFAGGAMSWEPQGRDVCLQVVW